MEMRKIMITINFDEEQIRYVTEDLFSLFEKQDKCSEFEVKNRIKYILKKHLENIELEVPVEIDTIDHD